MRLDNDRFYDPAFRGPPNQAPARLPGGWIPTTSVPGGIFYRNASDIRPGALGRFLTRIAGNAYALGGVMLLIGAAAVFVRQAPFPYQLVLGAPIFEEALKFGLALLLAYPLRFAALRLPVAWLVGAGFGWFEHEFSYPDEAHSSYIWRVVFHSGATMLSMATFHVMENAVDPRGRWASTLAATFIHYINNSLALVLIPIILLPAGVADAIGIGVNVTLAVATYAGTVMVLGLATRLRAFVASAVQVQARQAARPGVLR